jgi:hypothetical protein
MVAEKLFEGRPMRYLPIALVRGPMLTQLVHDAAQDPRRRRLCDCCGARVVLTSARLDQPVRCPACLRLQTRTEKEETPWRLSAAAAEALRRTKSWPRWS